MLVRGERVDLDVACRRADEEMGGGEGKSEGSDGIGGCIFFSVILVVVDRDDSACGSDRCRCTCASSTDGFPFVLLWLQLEGGGGGVGSRVTANDVSFPEQRDVVDVALGRADVQESFGRVDGECGRGACGGKNECAEEIKWIVEGPHLLGRGGVESVDDAAGKRKKKRGHTLTVPSSEAVHNLPPSLPATLPNPTHLTARL